MFKKEELRLLWPFYLFLFIEHIFGIGSLIWTVYFVQKGFSFTEVGVGMSILIVATFLFEVPTGAVADIFGRKTSVAIGFLLMILFAVLAPFIQSFLVLILLFTMMGIAITFRSGAEEAWVIDYLKKQNKKEYIPDFYVKYRSLASAGILLAGVLLTGILMVFDADETYVLFNHVFFGADFVWFFQAAGISFALLVLLLFTKEDFKRKKKKIHLQLLGVLHYSRKGASYIRHHTVLLLVFISMLLFGLIGGILGFAYQPMLIELGFELKDFGWMRSLAAVFGILLPFLAKPALRRYKDIKILRFSFILNCIMTLSIIFVAGPIVGLLLLIALFEIGSFTYPILNPFIQKKIPSRMRATITSMQSMVLAIGGAVSTLIAGPLVDVFGARLTIFASAFVFLPVIWIFFRIKR
ncbi:MFS transporter [Candidatus Woesearchaeota archaeon]|nr:MFS transporter [Candidatus Woesearchaeota archaeon]